MAIKCLHRSWLAKIWLADWLGLVRIIEQRTGLDGEKAIQTAKAKFNKRARVMGADEARNHMLKRARDCDREMAVIQS